MISTLGEFIITVTPTGEGDTMAVKVVCEKKREEINVKTAPYETPDQFGKRLRGILTALVNAEPRQSGEAPAKTPEPAKPWSDIKAAAKK